MHSSRLNARIEQEQHASIVALLESLAVTLFAVVTAAILPQLILQYLLRNGEMPTEQPMLLTYLPHIAYGFAALYFLVAFLGNIARRRTVRALREELAILEVTGDDCHCEHHHEGEEEMMMDMDAINEMSSEPMAEEVSSPTKTTRRSSVKKSTKKATKPRSKK